jgi:hypothetical protein
MILIAVTAICTLAGCQSNMAGKSGYVPSNCAAPGSSCSGGGASHARGG